MNTIKIRRDTWTNWNTENPTLELWEFWYETDSKKLKIWNGLDNWNSLDYFAWWWSSSLYQWALSWTINWTNKDFTIPQTPASSWLRIEQNGQLRYETLDYTIDWLTITFNTAPQTWDVLRYFIIKNITVAWIGWLEDFSNANYDWNWNLTSFESWWISFTLTYDSDDYLLSVNNWTNTWTITYTNDDLTWIVKS